MELSSAIAHYGAVLEPMSKLAPNMCRLAMAALLGGAIGLERELRHKTAGLRTNMFICIGSALFTILSDELAGGFGGDHTRVAAQIIPGIGFIGAGSILHSRGSVQGLTTAATLFVVASVGMAAGGGLYLTAVCSTILVLLALISMGAVELRFNLKQLPFTFDLYSNNLEQLTNSVHAVLQKLHQSMENMLVTKADDQYRMQFVMIGTQPQAAQLLAKLHQVACITRVETSAPTERE